MRPGSRATRLLATWRHPERRSIVRRTGDVLTLAGFALVPLFGLGVAGASYADLVLGLVVLVRGLQFVTEGLPLVELRRHGFVLFVLGLFAVGGAISGFAIGQPMPWNFTRILIATLGSVVIVSTYGTTTRELLPLLRALGLGTLVLALSGLLGLEAGGLGEQAPGRAQGYSIHPNLLGHSTLIGVAVAAYLAAMAQHHRERMFWNVCAALNVAALIASGSRGSFVGLWLGALVYLVLGGSRRAYLGALAATYLAVLALSTGVVSLPESNPIVRLQTDGAGSNSARQDQLRRDLEEVAEEPVFGSGFADITRIHVVYLQGWVGGGAICAISLMLLGGAMAVLPFGQPRTHLALACGATAIAVAWLFTNVLTTRDQWLFLVLAFRLCDPPAFPRLGSGSPAVAERRPVVARRRS